MFILPYKLLGFIAGINCLFYNLLVIPDNDFIVLFCVQFHMFRTVNMILKLKKNLALYNHIYSWCSYHKGTSSFDSPQSSLFSRFHSFFPAITSWCFFILFIYIFFLRLVWACLSSVRAAVNRFSAQISPRITVTRRLSKPSPVPSQPIQLYILHTTYPNSHNHSHAMSAPPRGIIIKFAYESISLAMHNDRQTDGRMNGQTNRRTDRRTHCVACR